MTSTELRSLRRGMLCLPLMARHQRAELAEQAGRVVRPGRGLGVVLHPESGRVEQRKPLHHAIVQVEVRYLRLAEFCFQRWERRGPCCHGWRLRRPRPGEGEPVVAAWELRLAAAPGLVP